MSVATKRTFLFIDFGQMTMTRNAFIQMFVFNTVQNTDTMGHITPDESANNKGKSLKAPCKSAENSIILGR